MTGQAAACAREARGGWAVKALRTLVRDYGWIHLSLGLGGNVAFVAGSVLFLPQFEPYKTAGVWLFVVGSSLMLVGAAGRLLVEIWKDR